LADNEAAAPQRPSLRDRVVVWRVAGARECRALYLLTYTARGGNDGLSSRSSSLHAERGNSGIPTTSAAVGALSLSFPNPP